MRPAAAALALAAALPLAAALSACQPDEHVILLTVGSQGDVDALEVLVLPIDPETGLVDPDGRRRRSGTVPQGRTRAEIDAEPIRVGIPLDGPAQVMVHLSGRSPTGDLLVATRCYEVRGVFRDSIMLVRADTTEDADADGFPRRPEATCFDLGGRPCPTAHMCPPEVGGDCDDRPACDPAAPPGIACTTTEDCPAGEACDADSMTCRCFEPSLVYPGAPALCNDLIDQNCDGVDEPCADRDGDGWRQCSGTDVLGTCDCDDDDARINPEATEAPVPPPEGQCGDGVDQDCDGRDEPCDRDGDGWFSDRPRGGSPDCDDEDAAVHPDASEICTPEGGTAVDEDCDGLVDELVECAGEDLDRDGYPACEVSPGPGCDCNDCDPGVHPGTEDVCEDGVDADCSTPDATSGDVPCSPDDMDRDNRTAIGGDCDDTDPGTYPGAIERCGDGVDQDCGMDGDGACADPDGDGWSEPAACEADAASNPAQAERCNGADDDCDGVTDEVLGAPTTSGSGAPLDQGERGCILAPAALMGIGGCVAGEPCSVDFRNGNIYHCGGCRVACNPGATTVADLCVEGACDCSTQGGIGACAPGDTCCYTTGTGCTNLLTDFANCGACGNPCDDRADQCAGGSCSCGGGAACGAGERCCGGTCVPRCSNEHCGACGNWLGPNMVCAAAGDTCRPTCVPPFDDCDGNVRTGCEVDLRTDRLHCGVCGNRCNVRNGTGRCEASTCRIDVCNVGYDDCNRSYADGCETALDQVTHCGACGVVCSPPNATGACGSRVCAIGMCSGGYAHCNASVADGCETSTRTLTDCGGCGVTCNLANATSNCGTGACRIQSCNPLFGDCDSRQNTGCEQSLETLAHCGGCTVPCSRANATATCAGGTCSIGSCSSNWANCDATDSNGCETQLRTTANCAGCMDACSAPMNATAACTSGSCTWSCNATYHQCGAMCASNTDPSNCGVGCVTCGVPPNATATCVSGSCDYTCSGAFQDCDGAAANGCECPGGRMCCGASCLDVSSDTSNCGACGRACGPGETCAGGRCVCGPDTGSVGDGRVCTAAQTCCASGCENTGSDASHCGGCGIACGPNETCSGGQCCCGTNCGAAGAGERCTGGGSDFCCAMSNSCVMNMASCS